MQDPDQSTNSEMLLQITWLLFVSKLISPLCCTTKINLELFRIVSAESNGMGPMSKSNAAITQSPFKPTISADKLIKNTIGYDASSNVTVLTPQNEGEGDINMIISRKL